MVATAHMPLEDMMQTPTKGTIIRPMEEPMKEMLPTSSNRHSSRHGSHREITILGGKVIDRVARSSIRRVIVFLINWGRSHQL